MLAAASVEDASAGGPAWGGSHPLVLASESATRRAVLADAGITCESLASGIDERALQSGLDDTGAEEIAAALARAKALAVGAARPGRLVLGADQVLEYRGRLLHKAGSREEASEQLLSLSGHTHRLISAFALTQDGAVLAAGRDEARLTMRDLDRRAIALYLDRGGAVASVGCYAIEGLGIHLFERVEGEHTTILGLPCSRFSPRCAGSAISSSRAS